MVSLSDQRVASAPSPDVLKQKALRSLGSLPPFSPILNRLLASLGAEDVSFAKLGDLIEKDTVVSGNILQLVNSALYARRGTVNSVRHAMSLLGVGKLRNTVLGMSITRMWNQVHGPSPWSMARFNVHSAAVAILSDLLAQRLPVSYAEGAFVAGLLHDIGRLLIALGLTREYEMVLELHETSGRSYLDCEREILGFTHPELSAEALAFWNLPEPIQVAVRQHHDPAADNSIQREEISLSRVIDAANRYVNAAGISILASNGADSADAMPIRSLGLDADRLEGVLAEFQTEYNVMVQLFH